ncbi:DNA excision repair protein ckn1 [Cladobotryum mycophilum]|uniref:DNA excision repair protein ckn1 n=1 Tax=Cladobotryum mycophilum TaxID=491253 RepID=A0ABR0S5B0_9HYPO
MQARLFARESGDLRPRDFSQATTAELLRSFAPAPQHRYNGETTNTQNTAFGGSGGGVDERPHNLRAHGAGVSSLAIEKFDGRILVSGGPMAPSSSGTWTAARIRTRFIRLGRHGITHLAFYPFDPDAFLSSSYDKTLKLWATGRSSLSAEFDLNATIYSHSTSSIAGHLLVACATQHSTVRLVDLKSGSAVQALVAHGGPVLCASWSPRHEHILEDSLGVVHRFKHAVASGGDVDGSSTPRFRSSAQAHDEAVNGLQWTDDGRYIVSAGLDRRIRVWDADNGANTLASFGPVVQNQHAKTANFLLSPSGLSAGRRQVLIWPNDQEILVLDLHEGTVITRLKSPGGSSSSSSANPLGPRGSEMGRNRITSIAWRGMGVIRAWMPQLPGPEDVDEDDELNGDEEVKKRKRKAVDDAYRSLMGKQITFT